MIVRIKLDVSDEQRRYLRGARGRAGLATRAEIVRVVEMLWAAHSDDMAWEYENAMKEAAEARREV